MALAQFIHAPEFEGKEKHVPDMALSTSALGTVVTIQVGKEVVHPTTKEHHIEWVKVFGETQDGKFVEIGELNFGKGTAFPHGSLVIKRRLQISDSSLVLQPARRLGQQPGAISLQIRLVR